MITKRTWLGGLFVGVLGAACAACAGQGAGEEAAAPVSMQRIALPIEQSQRGDGPVVQVGDGEAGTVGWYDTAAGTLRFTGAVGSRFVCHLCELRLATAKPRWLWPPGAEGARERAVAVRPSEDDLLFQVDRPLVAGEVVTISIVDSVTGAQREAGTFELASNAR